MTDNLPGRAPAGIPAPTRRAASLADGIKQAQQAAKVGEAVIVAPEPPILEVEKTHLEMAPGAADALRSRLVELFENSKITLASFYQYSQTAAALAEEYHAARLAEKYPGVGFAEYTLATSLDARETPTTLDKKLAELTGVTVRMIIYDRVQARYYLYV